MDLMPRTNKFYLDDFFDDFLANKDSNMKCDIFEKDGDYHIEMEIPGFDKKDIKIETKNGYLTVTAEKTEKEEEKDKNYIRRERNYGKYSRSFYLGDLDEEKINAKFLDGMLKIIVPKEASIENKKVIEIE